MSHADTKPSLGTCKDTDDEPRLVATLLSISDTMRALTGLKLAQMGFHNGQDELLMALHEEAPVPVSRVADELRVRPSTVSKMLDRLVAKGLVDRVADKRDARRTMVRITPAGLDARSGLLEMRACLEAELKATLSDGGDPVTAELEAVATLLSSRLSRLH